MYPKNRMPMYEGDSFIRVNPIQVTAEDSTVSVADLDADSRVESGLGLSRAARNLLHKFAESIITSVRHPQAKTIEN